MKFYFLISFLLIRLLSYSQWIDITPDFDLRQPIFFFDIDIIDENNVYFIGNSSSSSFIVKSINQEEKWDLINIELPSKPDPFRIHSIDFLNNSTFVFAQSSEIVIVLNNDTIESRVRCAFCKFFDIFFFKDSSIVLGTNYFTTYDLGLSWQNNNRVGHPEAFSINEDTVVFASTTEYDNMGNTYEGIYYSTNRGQSSKHLNVLSNNRKFKNMLHKNNTIYAVGEQSFFGLTSNKLLWFEEINTNTDQELIGIDVVSEKDWFICGGFNRREHNKKSGIILGTRDGGKLWHFSTFPEQITKIKMLDAKIDYAISNYRIYKTTNGGLKNILEDENTLELIPYPNPTNSVLHTHNNTEKSIYNLQGQLLWQGKDKSIEVRHWQKGMYLLRTKDKTYRWIKQ